MIYHILNGDAMIDRFEGLNLSGEMLSMRECLIEGDLGGNTLEEFINTRARYLTIHHGADPNNYAITDLIHKVLCAPEASEFYLWFEYDLFCQVNLWFVLSLIRQLHKNKKVWMVYPTSTAIDVRYRGFGSATVTDMSNWYQCKIQCMPSDIDLATRLWNAYRVNDLNLLQELSSIKSECFPYLEEVCGAHIDRSGLDGLPGRPEKRIQSILNEYPSADFNLIFKEFTKWEGVYGFGDVQLIHILDKMTKKSK